MNRFNTEGVKKQKCSGSAYGAEFRVDWTGEAGLFSNQTLRSLRSCPNAETATLIPAFSHTRSRFRGVELGGRRKEVSFRVADLRSMFERKSAGMAFLLRNGDMRLNRFSTEGVKKTKKQKCVDPSRERAGSDPHSPPRPFRSVLFAPL